MAAYATLLLAWSAVIGIPNDTVGVVLWLWLFTIAWNVEAPRSEHLRFVRDWWLPLLLLVLYWFLRGLADEVGLSVHVTEPIRFDEWLGGGTAPTVILQREWCGTPCTKGVEPRWYDVALTTVYASHFLTGLTIAAVLWVRKRTEWLRWMRRYVTISFAALAVYILYPMAPPWMSAEQGHIAADLPRITSRGWRDVGLDRFDLVLQGVGNPVAAMPSLHAGIAFLVAMFGIWRLHSPLRWLLVLYPLAMSTALVYYAEHYVIDIVAGVVLAAAVMIGVGAWEQRRALATPRSTAPRG